MEKPYFEIATQVMFADPDAPGEWKVGIAYKDEIICACCGGIFEIADVCDMAEELGLRQGIYPYENWVDLTYEMSGGELPEGLIENPDGEGLMEVPLEDEFIQMELADVEAFAGDWYTDGRSDEKIFN